MNARYGYRAFRVEQLAPLRPGEHRYRLWFGDQATEATGGPWTAGAAEVLVPYREDDELDFSAVGMVPVRRAG